MPINTKVDLTHILDSHTDYDVFQQTFGQSPGHQKDKSPTSGILKKKEAQDFASPLQLSKPRIKSKKEILKQKMKKAQ